MTDQMILNIVRDSFYYVLLVSGPILLVSLVVGLMISMFQAATTISEQTLTFVPKIIAVFFNCGSSYTIYYSKVKVLHCSNY